MKPQGILAATIAIAATGCAAPKHSVTTDTAGTLERHDSIRLRAADSLAATLHHVEIRTVAPDTSERVVRIERVEIISRREAEATAGSDSAAVTSARSAEQTPAPGSAPLLSSPWPWALALGVAAGLLLKR